MHGFDTSKRRTTDDDIADIQSSALDHDFTNHTAVGLLLGLQTRSEGRTFGIRFVFVELGGDQDGFQQLV